MVFEHYSEEGAALAADVANTDPTVAVTEASVVADPSALEGFLDARGLERRRGLGERDLARFLELRARLLAVFSASGDADTAARINDALQETGARVQVVLSGGDWQVGFVPPGDGPIEELAATATVGLAALFAQTGRARFGRCSAPDCRDVYIDTSRNRSRRYCSDSCSSRTNVAAFRARKRSSDAG